MDIQHFNKMNSDNMGMLAVKYVATEGNGLEVSGTFYMIGCKDSVSTNNFIRDMIIKRHRNIVMINSKDVTVLSGECEISAKQMKAILGAHSELWPKKAF